MAGRVTPGADPDHHHTAPSHHYPGEDSQVLLGQLYSLHNYHDSFRQFLPHRVRDTFIFYRSSVMRIITDLPPLQQRKFYNSSLVG